MPIHPSIVHLPIALSVLMPLLAMGLLVAWWRDWLPRRVWIIGLLMQALLVGSSWAALETGEADEERVEKVLANEDPLDAHEEAAEVFFFAAIGVLTVFAASAFMPNAGLGRSLATLATVGTFVVAGLAYRVGHAGGRLVYQEGAAQAYTGSTAGAAPVPSMTRPHDDDDDD